MNKLYDRIDFVNNTTPALNETNLNAMSKAIDDIDDRVIDIAGDVLVVVPEILDKYADIEALATNPPYIGNNGHWWTWDTDLNQYVDSGVDAGVSVNVGTTTTLPAGSDATVTNSGTDTDPILNFGIPQGVAGQNGQDGADGQDGVSPEVTVASITGGHSVTITDADHPTGQTFNVMDGTNGQGVPASGTTGQVLTKASNADYDTTWTTPSGGSGGHTILNSSGTAMNQRGKLQFDGATVTDDSANDKTIVTTTPQSMIGDEWVSGHSYAVDDYAIDANGLYKNGTAHTSTATNRPSVNQSGYWTLVSVSDELKGSDYSSLTPTSNFEIWNTSDGRRLFIKKIEDVVYFQATIKIKTSLSANTTYTVFDNLPNDINPKFNAAICGYLVNGSSGVLEGYVAIYPETTKVVKLFSPIAISSGWVLVINGIYQA